MAGKGFAAGMAERGTHDRDQAQAQGQFEMEQARASADAFNESITAMIDRNDEMLAKLGLAAGEVAKRVPDATTSAEVAELRTQAMKIVQGTAAQLASSSQALQDRGIAAEVFAGLPDLNQFVDGRMASLFDGAMQAGVTLSPIAAGTASAQQLEVTADHLRASGKFSEKQIATFLGMEKGSLVSFEDKAQSAFDTTSARSDVELLDTIRAAGDAAWGRRIEYGRIMEALDSGRFTTGIFADSRSMVSKLFELVGVSVPEGIIGDAATADTLDSAANTLGVQVAGRMSRVTNLSLKFIENSMPALTKTPEGNRLIVEVLDRIAQREMVVAELSEEYRGYGTLRPEGKLTFHQAIKKLDAENPVLSEEIKERIRNGTRGAPDSFKAFEDWTKPWKSRLPKGVPQGSTHLGNKGGVGYYRGPDGKAIKIYLEDMPEVDTDAAAPPEEQ